MAASKPTSSLSEKPHLLQTALSMDLGTLTRDLGCFPFDRRSFAPVVLLPETLILGIRSLVGLTRFLPIQPIQCSTPQGYFRRYAKTYFGENQLFPSSISFSLLPTSHPRESHDSPVRASICISTNFTLLMGSSPGFGSYAYDIIRAIHTRFPFASTPDGFRRPHA